MTTPNATVLRNKGVPVKIIDLVPNADGELEPIPGPKGDPKLAEVWVRFDANAIADIEEEFGSLEAFQNATNDKPFTALRSAMSIVMGVDKKHAGKAMLADKVGDYASAVGVALALANGVDPTQAAEMLQVGITAAKQVAEERKRLVAESIAEAKKAAAEAQSTGTSGSSPGQEPAEALTSSGD